MNLRAALSALAGPPRVGITLIVFEVAGLVALSYLLVSLFA